MIRFRLNERINPLHAATCQHPAFARLAGLGPWQAQQHGSATVLTRLDALNRTDWGDWRPGLGQLDYAVPEPLPPFAISDWLSNPPREGIPVRLRCGLSVPVAPAYLDGVEVMLDGSLAASVSPYGQLVQKLWDRTAHSGIGPADPEVIEFCRLALASCLRLPAEAIHAWHLLSTSDVQALFDAATTLPKTAAGALG